MKKLICTAAAVMGIMIGVSTASYAAWEGLSYKNSCNTAEDVPSAGAILVDDAEDRAPDGTAYLKGSTETDDLLLDGVAFEVIFSSKAVSSFCTWEADVMFTDEGTGFSIRNNAGATNGKVNTTLVYGDGYIRFSKATGTKLCEASLNTWYHVNIMGAYGQGEEDAVLKINIYEYAVDGTLNEVGEAAYPGMKYGDLLRNDYAPTRFVVNPGTCVDNLAMYEMPAKALNITPNGNINVTAGESVQFSSQLYADEAETLKMTGYDVIYELLTEDKSDYLISDTITVTPETGLLNVAGQAESQTFTVRARCVDFPEISDDITVTVSSVPMLEFIGAGFDETYTKLVNLKYNQYYENEGDIQFITVFYNADGILIDMYIKELAYADQKTGETIITLNRDLPEGFDVNTGEMKVFVWSKTFN